MELIEKKSVKFVRIIIGNAKTGDSNIKKPTKSISVRGTSVDEVYKKICEMVKREQKA